MKTLQEECLRVDQILEAGRVQRFHATPRVLSQTVGEHVYGVVALGAYIRLNPSPDFLVACLLHDAAELHTGDIPFTAKRGCFQSLKHQMESAEQAVLAEYMWPMPALNKQEELILKLADMLEGLRYVSHSELGEPIVGTRWWVALDAMFHLPEMQLLEIVEREKAYALFKAFSPASRRISMYETLEECWEFTVPDLPPATSVPDSHPRAQRGTYEARKALNHEN